MIVKLTLDAVYWKSLQKFVQLCLMCELVNGEDVACKFPFLVLS